MRYMTRLIIFLLLVSPFPASAQEPVKDISVNPMAFYRMDTAIANLLRKDLDIFLDDVKNNPFASPVIDKNYIEQDPDAFVFFTTADNGGTCQPVLVHVNELNATDYMLKLAYTKTDETGTTINCIYNLLARRKGKGFTFFSPAGYYAAGMRTYTAGTVTYKYSDNINKEACKKMDMINRGIAELFQQPVRQVTYYKFKNAVALFNHLGFEYLPNMYFDTTGGFIKHQASVVLAANNAEIYEHEFVHFYTRGINNRQVNHYADEGVATLIGGSGGIMYNTGIKIIYNRIKEKNITNIYEGFVGDFQIDKKVSVKYFLSAMICKLIKDKQGMAGLTDMLKTANTLGDFLNKTNEVLQLNEQNFNTRIMELLQEEAQKLSAKLL
jgi:hypothetical protein